MIKRAFDLACATAGILILSPLLLAIAVAVKLSSRGPAIHRARRVGLDGAPFDLFKFRSMTVGSTGGPAITSAGDPRVTPFGQLLRRTKLDELPQLFNVVRGEMSLVGPRPEDPHYVAMYDERQRQILAVRPGITSAASLAYRDEESRLSPENWESVYVTEIMPAKLRIDLDYLRNASLARDLGLILRSIAAMFGKGN